MRKMHKTYIICLCLLLSKFSICYALTHPAASLMPVDNGKIPAPHTRYAIYYTLNADDGVLQKKSFNDYTLSLYALSKTVTYKINDKKNHKGLMPLKKFITHWKKNSAQSIEADISGTQADHKSAEQKQVYHTVKLSDLNYDATHNSISFKINTDQPISFTKFTNASVFINGCDFCDCKTHTHKLSACLVH